VTSRDFVMFALQLASMLAVAGIFGQLMRRLRQPAVLGEMLGGVVLGVTVLGAAAPQFHEWLFDSSANAAVSRDAAIKLGMLFFLFVAGVELDLSDLRRLGRRAATIGIVGTVVPIAAGVGLVYAIPKDFWGDAVGDHRLAFALFVGMNLANSANPVLARILADLGLLRGGIGSLAMTATIVDDLVNWVVFAVILRDIAPSASGSVASGGLLLSIGTVVVLFAVLVGGGRLLGPPLLEWLKERVTWPSGFVAVSALVVLLAAGLSEAVGVHAFLGAFLIGVGLGGHHDLGRAAHDVISRFAFSFFAPIYFVSIGMSADFLEDFDLLLVLVVTTAALVSKLGGVLLGSKLAGMPLDREAWGIAWGLNARGATGIILASVGRSAGVIDDRLYVAIVVMALFTSLVAGPMMRRTLFPRPSPATDPTAGGPAIGRSSPPDALGASSPPA